MALFTEMTGPVETQVAEDGLPPGCAFVVHFRISSAFASAKVSGRVEHIVSGKVAHFASLEDLLAFVTRVLAAYDGGSAGARGNG